MTIPYLHTMYHNVLSLMSSLCLAAYTLCNPWFCNTLHWPVRSDSGTAPVSLWQKGCTEKKATEIDTEDVEYRICK
jgi:hypothetical protein